jgi:mRNA interferase RelE/StbE
LVWTLRFSAEALRQLRRIDPVVQRRILTFLNERVAHAEDPSRLGQRLKGSLKAYWRFRVGDYRIICDIQRREITILVIAIGHRRDIYE